MVIRVFLTIVPAALTSCAKLKALGQNLLPNSPRCDAQARRLETSALTMPATSPLELMALKGHAFSAQTGGSGKWERREIHPPTADHAAPSNRRGLTVLPITCPAWLILVGVKLGSGKDVTRRFTA